MYETFVDICITCLCSCRVLDYQPEGFGFKTLPLLGQRVICAISDHNLCL